jgi:hypothetical protein
VGPAPGEQGEEQLPWWAQHQGRKGKSNSPGGPSTRGGRKPNLPRWAREESQEKAQFRDYKENGVKGFADKAGKTARTRAEQE